MVPEVASKSFFILHLVHWQAQQFFKCLRNLPPHRFGAKLFSYLSCTNENNAFINHSATSHLRLPCSNLAPEHAFMTPFQMVLFGTFFLLWFFVYISALFSKREKVEQNQKHSKTCTGMRNVQECWHGKESNCSSMKVKKVLE